MSRYNFGRNLVEARGQQRKSIEQRFKTQLAHMDEFQALLLTVLREGIDKKQMGMDNTDQQLPSSTTCITS